MSKVTYSALILGGTGGLGKHISLAFLTDFKSSFHTVRIGTRDPSSATAKELSEKGASIAKLDESDLARSLDEAFEGIDVVVNALSTRISSDAQQAVIEAAARSSIKVFFLDEFGTDHRINDFPGYDHPRWLNKQKIAAETRKQLKGKKVIAVYTSLLLDYALVIGDFADAFL
ncbi:hypothetical protein BD414DRAFT_477005 [Trametes punicea]|nr:hypothetical protein BD414DRAFT_477005 [Trametes punicea]